MLWTEIRCLRLSCFPVRFMYASPRLAISSLWLFALFDHPLNLAIQVLYKLDLVIRQWQILTP
jgi:hypothetical protein